MPRPRQAISGEHGLGTEKKKYFLELEDPVKIELMRRIKASFDPNGILNPGKIFWPPCPPARSPPTARPDPPASPP